MPLNQSGSRDTVPAWMTTSAAAAGEELVEVLRGRRVSMLPASCACRIRTSVSSSCALVGKRLRAGGPRAALVEQRHPFAEEARIIVRARAVGFRARADEHAQRAPAPSAVRGAGRA